MSVAAAFLLLVLAPGLAGCGGSESRSPLAPSPSPQAPSASGLPPTTAALAVFTDAATGFSTSDVHDVQEQIVRFNSANELVWVATDARFPEFIVDGTFIGYHHRADKFFQVRFGTVNGQRRAYLTWPDDRRTIIDVWVNERGDLKIAETAVPVPGS